MDGKIMIRCLKVICVLSLLCVIFFYQGQTSPGCPGGSGLPPGCNPGGKGDGSNPTPTDCGSIQKDTECNSKADCGWYEPPSGQTATPAPTPDPPHCSKDKDGKDRDETSCKSVLNQGCVWSNSKCITWKAFCEAFRDKDKDEIKCKEAEYQSGKKICQWNKDKTPPCSPNTPPEARPVTTGEAVCQKIDTFCGNFGDPTRDNEPRKCNDEQTHKKCQWRNGQCVPKTTAGDCNAKKEGECNSITSCVWDTAPDPDVCKTIQAYCDEADGTNQKTCEDKVKGTTKVCTWVAANNDCKPIDGATQPSTCRHGDIIKPVFGDDNGKCPSDLQNVECPCKECFTVTNNQPPQDNNTSKGYGFVKYDSKIGILCCNGLYYNKSIDLPKEETNPPQVKSDIATNYAVRNPQSPDDAGVAKTLKDAVDFCRRIWNGVNIEVQTYYSGGKTTYVGANKYNRCGKGEDKNAVRCIDVQRKNPNKTTKHIFCCGSEQYLDTFYIKKEKGGDVSKEATALPYVWWKDNGERKFWVEDTEKDYTGPGSLNGHVLNDGKVCQNCAIDDTHDSVIEKIYDFYKEKIFSIDGRENVNTLLSVPKEYYEYFYSDNENLQLDSSDKIANFLRETVAVAPTCKAQATQQGQQVTGTEHFTCCFTNGEPSNCTKGAGQCDGCKKKLIDNLLAQIKKKLEAICKNIQQAGDDSGAEACIGKKDTECKAKLHCQLNGSNCEPAQLFVKDGNTIKINEQGKDVEVTSDFFSSQRCGADE